MDFALNLFVGIGLSAACGFRIFIPLLVLSVATQTGHFQPSAELEWIGTWPVLISLFFATITEVGAYYFPWIDNFLDSAATPFAIVAGTMLTGSMLGDISPFSRWSLALIAGGGVSGLTQFGSVAIRGLSSATTMGLGNWIVATVEWIVAIALAILAIFLPVFCLFVVLVICYQIVRRAIWHVAGKKSST